MKPDFNLIAKKHLTTPTPVDQFEPKLATLLERVWTLGFKAGTLDADLETLAREMESRT